jgi:DNA-binding transcriptional MerR regulator
MASYDSMEPRWTLEELRRQARRAVADLGRQAASHLTDRTIRYYTTLGLVDRPLGVRGRTVLYGPRHLLQVLAIRRLQEQGLTLAEMQRRQSTRMPTARLESLARTGSAGEVGPVAERVAPYAAAPAREPDVWREAPASWKPPARESRESRPPAATARLLQVIELAPGVTLALPATRKLGAIDVAALQTAAVTLLRELTDRRLLPEDEEKKKEGG